MQPICFLNFVSVFYFTLAILHFVFEKQRVKSAPQANAKRCLKKQENQANKEDESGNRAV